MKLDLDLDLDTVAGPGRPQKRLEFAVVRDLGAADFELLKHADRGVVPANLQRITDRHHALARLLATGMSDGEAAMVTGYDPSRVSILKNSPAFVELLELYRKEITREFTTIHEHMSGLTKDALLELRQRVEDDPQKFTPRELLQIVNDMSDRSGDDADFAKLPTRIEIVAPGMSDDDSAD